MKLFSFKKIDRPELKESVGDYTLILIGSFIQALGINYQIGRASCRERV